MLPNTLIVIELLKNVENLLRFNLGKVQSGFLDLIFFLLYHFICS